MFIYIEREIKCKILRAVNVHVTVDVVATCGLLARIVDIVNVNCRS